MKIINKIILVFCVVLLLLCFVGCNKAIKDNDSAPQNPTASQQPETSSDGKNNITNNNGSKPNTLPNNNVQSLPDDFVNNADSDDEIDSGDLDGGSSEDKLQNSDNSQDNKPSGNDEEIEYDDNSGWSSGWN